MWEGKVDKRLIDLLNAYEAKFEMDADEYEEIAYYAMTYEEFVGYIEECLEKNLEIPDVVV